MKKVKFEIGDRVSTIIDNQMFEGYIKGLHLELPIPIAIIEFDDGTYAKVNIDNIIPEHKDQEKQAVKNESQEGAKVITKDRFIEAVNHVTSPEGILGDKVGEVDPMVVMLKSMSVAIVGLKISEKLFQDKEEIEITKDQLKDTIRDNTNPVEIAKTTDGKMSTVQALPIATLSTLVLMKLINILFDDSEND